MDDFVEYKIVKVGELKYDRLRSMSILRTELKSFDYEYSLSDIKDLLDSILGGNFDKSFNLKFKRCFDYIFDGNEYEHISNYEDEKERNFPYIWIPPRG